MNVLHTQFWYFSGSSQGSEVRRTGHERRQAVREQREAELRKGEVSEYETRIFLFKCDTKTYLKTLSNEVISIYRSQERWQQKREEENHRKREEEWRERYVSQNEIFRTCMYIFNLWSVISFHKNLLWYCRNEMEQIEKRGKWEQRKGQ